MFFFNIWTIPSSSENGQEIVILAQSDFLERAMEGEREGERFKQPNLQLIQGKHGFGVGFHNPHRGPTWYLRTAFGSNWCV
jgi:hypothetical protein